VINNANVVDDLLRVAFVEDHEAVRKGIETVLGRRGCVFTTSVGTAAEGYAMISAKPPDVVLLDISLPDESGASLARRLLAKHPELGILLYTGLQDHEALRSALDCGARGFALKAGGIDELRDAVSTVAAGGTYMDPRLRPIVLASNTTEGIPILSTREREVLDLLARGLTGEDAAGRLGISPETVRVHVRNAMRKLDAGTRVHAVAIAIREGEIAF
jgi:DNA-binding NarL/FixJ family response regulator